MTRIPIVPTIKREKKKEKVINHNTKVPMIVFKLLVWIMISIIMVELNANLE